MFDLKVLKLRPIYRSSFAPSATDNQIRDLERHFGYILPEAYKEILRKYNGSDPELNHFDSDDETYTLNYFYALDEDQTSPTSIRWAINEFSTFLGPSTLPFAENAVNEVYFFKLINHQTQVWILRYDELEEPETDFVINSFDELIRALYDAN